MAIYNKRVRFDLNQWSCHFQRRNSFVDILYSIIRFLVIIVENLYCIPSYLVLSWLVLLPTSWLRSDLYSRLENYLYNSLLFIVSSWSLAAGLTIVESGDEFKYLIEEPERSHLERNENSAQLRKQTVTSCNNITINSTRRYLDSDGRVVVNGYANKANTESLQVNGRMNTNTRARSNGKLKSNGLLSNGITNGHHKHDGDNLPKNGHYINNDKQHNGFHAQDATYHPLHNTAAENDIVNNNNNNNEDNINITPKQNGRHITANSANLKKNVNCESSLASRMMNVGSLKTAQAKPRILLLCNHISTADVPLMMQSFSTLTNQSILWVLDAQFKMTNFGVVCGSHGDFFVDKNSYSDGALREHVLKYPDRNLLVLFPEGGFLRKRIDGSNRYASRNGLPFTKYVTHPRYGAFKDLTDPSVGITHIVDATLIYDNIKDPISILDIAFGNKKQPAILHFRVYDRSEINPSEEWLRSIWLAKDKLLANYYEDKVGGLKEFSKTFRVATLDWFKVLSVHLFYLLVCYLAIFRLFNATSVTMLKARELYYSNI